MAFLPYHLFTLPTPSILREAGGKALGRKGGKGFQQGKGGKDLSEEREKIPGREKALGGKGGKDLNREMGAKDLREEKGEDLKRP